MNHVDRVPSPPKKKCETAVGPPRIPFPMSCEKESAKRTAAFLWKKARISVDVFRDLLGISKGSVVIFTVINCSVTTLDRSWTALQCAKGDRPVFCSISKALAETMNSKRNDLEEPIGDGDGGMSGGSTVPVEIPVAMPIPKAHPLSPSTAPPKIGGNINSSGTNGNHNGTTTRPSTAATEVTLTDESLDESNDDLESLLPHSANGNGGGGNNGGPSASSSGTDGAGGGTGCIGCTPLEIHMREEGHHEGDTATGRGSGRRTSSHPFGRWIRPYSVGNMNILFPEYFHSSGWGVVGPHFFGPVCVWFILLGASHLCVRAVYRHGLGTPSLVVCYLFLALSTYRLTDVSLRDPGICLDREIPSHVTPEQADRYRFCDRCRCWQPPDGIHCPECNVCVAGYDHHCVWMGTCIGKRNYRQFVLFNVSWLYYVGYAVLWLATIGPFVMQKE
jgi:DHHC palmitoyltransferase